MVIFKEEQRPLLTIVVLVFGVVGGLTCVISVVYLYRFCLKKRKPVSTTANPDSKREHIRSVVVGLSRPLPLPPEFLASSAATPKHTSTTSLAFDDDVIDVETNNRSIVPLLVANDSNYALRLSQNTYNTLLSVSPAPTRAHSAELLQPDQISADEARRSSFEVPRGIGRQLPSTQGLENPRHPSEHDRQRRMSNFARSNAVQYNMSPRKQISSPLPAEPRRIYERGHAHSRSWNPSGMSSSSSPPPPAQQIATYRNFDYKTTDEFVTPRMIDVPIINEPPSPTPRVNQERRRSFVPRQAKSFDDRNTVNDRRHALDQRSYTLAEKMLRDEEEKVQVSVACQSLWAAKGHLEHLHALGISEPSSVSTSFESNTDSQATGDTLEQQRNQNAKGKRLQYKSLLLQRQFLSTAAVSSMESNISTDDSDPIFASSFDSTRSELERRRLSLMNQTDQNDSDDACAASTSQRDYSVDATSDSLFREWSRVDPAYATDHHRHMLQRGHTVDHAAVAQQPNHHHFQRQFSLAASSPMAQNHRRHTMVSYRDG